uniref:Uncharacterized protein n=1 Tax=Acrobeloides nanus TaxID=290746 RepID=A0A914D8A9_9BILA
MSQPSSSIPKVGLHPKGVMKRPTKLKQQIQNLRISSKFESETKASTSDQLDLKLIEFLKKIKGFQDRKHHENSVKAKMRKRLVYGMREIQRDTVADLIKLVLVSNDVEHFE